MRALNPSRRASFLAALFAAALGLSLPAAPALSMPYIWDEDGDRMDDRIETTALLGISAAYENGNVNERLRFAAFVTSGILSFETNVRFEHAPTVSDIAAVNLTGAKVKVRYRSIPYLRVSGTWTQTQLVKNLPGVERIEAISALYPVNNVGAGTIQARAGSGTPAPDVATVLGTTGQGVTVAILDTGVNDAPFGLYPGNASLLGKAVGGGNFFSGDSTTNTPFVASVNPADPFGQAGGFHGTHVAGTILGTGGGNPILAGVAPGARFVDVKVLSDAGVGFGVADGIEWCIQNRNRSWGLTGSDTIYAGIDVLNLSLSSIDRSDGNDADAQIVNAAAQKGLVVVAAMGNDGLTAYVPSPASADRAVAVGAIDDRNTGNPADDLPAAFSNTGPRDSDGDGDTADEIRPTVKAPGVGIASADGDPHSDGNEIQVLSGTSMATGFVSGVAALVKSAQPSLSSGQVARILRETAGGGVVNAYAALLEIFQPASTQVVRIGGAGAPSPPAADVTWDTQREKPASAFRIQRAPDVNGAPGAWMTLGGTPIAATGDSSLSDGTNRNAYAYHDDSPLLVAYANYWYRVHVLDPGGAFDTPAVRVRLGAPAPYATVRYSIVHTTPDNDLEVRIGGGFPENPTWQVEGPGAVEADSFQVVPGEATTGILRWFFHRSVEGTEISQEGGLPTMESPWFLAVTEGGYLNRIGRIDSFSIDSGAGHLETFLTVPAPTVEGQTTSLYLPEGAALGVNDPGPPTARNFQARFHPNPFRPEAALHLTVPARISGTAIEVRLFDSQGRGVRRLHHGPLPAGETSIRWDGRDDAGRELPAGEYFFRVAGGGMESTGKVLLVH